MKTQQDDVIEEFEIEEFPVEGMEVQSEPEPVEKPEMSAVESAGWGAVSGLPFGKNIGAATQTLMETVTDSEKKSFGERYYRNLAAWEGAIDQAREEDPEVYYPANLATDIAAFSVLPGATSVPKVFSWGAAQYLSNDKHLSMDSSADDLAWSVAGAGVAGAAGVKVGQMVGSAISKAGPAMQKLRDSTLGAWITENMGNHVKTLNAHIEKWYNPAGKLSINEMRATFMDDVLNLDVNGMKLIQPGISREVLRNNANTLKNTIGSQMDDVLSKSDELISGDVIYADIKSAVNRQLTSGRAELVAETKAALDGIMDDFFVIRPQTILDDAGKIVKDVPGVPVKKTLKEWHQTKRDVANASVNLVRKIRGSTASSIENSKNDVLEQQVNVLSRYIGNKAEKIQIAEGSSTTWKTLTKNYATADTLYNISDEILSSSGFSGIIQRAKQLLMGGGVAFTAHAATGLSYANSIGLGILTKEAMNSNTIEPKLAGGLMKLSSFMERVPMHPISVSVTRAAQLTTKEFHDSLMGSISEVELMEAPLARSSQEVINNSDNILQVAQKYDGNLATELRRAIEDEDHEAIGATMDALSKNPNVRKYVQSGQGWNGKVYTPEDKAALIGNIQKTNMPFKQKMEQLKAVREQGLIPMEAPRQPEYFQYVARDRKNPDF